MNRMDQKHNSLQEPNYAIPAKIIKLYVNEV